MSSPRRATKDALERAAKAARGSRPATPLAKQSIKIAAVCRLYTARREAGEQFAPVAKNSISATDVMVTASGLLRAADLAAFELGMWQGWTGR